MLSALDSFHPKEIMLETIDVFSSLSNPYKGLCIALTILGTICFIVPGIVLFRLSAVKFQEWENESKAKQTANKVDVTVNLNRNDTAVQPSEEKVESQNSVPIAEDLVGKKSTEDPVLEKSCTHQKMLLKSFTTNLSEKEASNLLIKGNPGDYILIKRQNAPNVIRVVYLTEQKNVSWFELSEGDNGDFYDLNLRGSSSLRNLNDLKNPLHPGISQENCAQIQGALNDHKYLCLTQALSVAVKKEALNYEFIGTDAPFDLYGLLEWLKECPDVPTRDRLVSTVFPFFSKAYGHIFGLNGKIEVEGKEIELEGMFSRLAMSLVGTCQREHLQDTQLLSKEEKECFADFINCNCNYFSFGKDSPEKKIHKDIEKGKIVSFSSGWEGHAINITLSKDLIGVTNRGDRVNGLESGTYFYKIKDFARFTPEKIALYFAASQQKNDLVFEQLIKDLNEDILSMFYFHKSADQRVGNCSFINNVTNSFATAFIYEYRKNQNLDESRDFGERFYREARVHSKTMMLDFWKRLQIIIPEEKKKEHFDIFQAFNRLLFRKNKVKKQDSKNKKIKDPKEYDLLYRHAHEMMSQCALSLHEVLPQLNYIGQKDYSQFPEGTFGFSKPSQWAYHYSVGINVKDDPLEWVAIALKEEIGNSYTAEIMIRLKDSKNLFKVQAKDVKTIGDIVNKTKEATIAAVLEKGNVEYKGLELKFIV